MKSMLAARYNFLIADDIVMNRFLLKEIVSEIANQVFEARNGRETIALLKEKPVDIILLDIEMPDMNGVDTARFIRKEMEWPLSQTAIVALTAHNPADFFKSFHSAGFDQLITKPYSIEKIINVIHTLDLTTKSR
jgi:CheY-like chemotaxis protein